MLREGKINMEETIEKLHYELSLNFELLLCSFLIFVKITISLAA